MKEKAFRTVLILCFVLFMAFFRPAPAVFESQGSITANAAVKMKLNETNITLKVSEDGKETCQLKVIGAKKKVKWSSSDPKTASVTRKGKVTARNAGKATITAKVSGKSLKCKVTVKKTAVDKDTDDGKNADGDKNSGADNGQADGGKSDSDAGDQKADDGKADAGDQKADDGKSDIGDQKADDGKSDSDAGDKGKAEDNEDQKADGGKTDSDAGDSGKTDNSETDHKGNQESETPYDLLYRIIMEKGYLNSDHNRVIKESRNGYDYAIVYNSKTEQFEFIGLYSESISNNSFVINMKLGRNGSKSTAIKCYFKVNKLLVETEARFNLDEYVLENDALDYKVNFKSFMVYDSDCIELSKASCKLCMVGWDLCIRKNSNWQLSLEDVGFVNLDYK